MKLFDMIFKDNEIVLFAINTISYKDDAIDGIKKYLLNHSYSGFLILDYLIFCKSLDSFDRFIGFRVNNGSIDFNEKFILSDRYVFIKNIANEHFARNEEQVLKYSILKDSEKKKLLK